jgi:4-hydroxy-tetrahydrodipicolinate synthase
MSNFAGVFPVVPAPFHDSEELDLLAVDHVIDFVLAHGAHGVVVAPAEGESGRLSLDERRALIERVMARVQRRVPVLLGASHPANFHALRLVAHGARLQVSGFVVAPPPGERRSEEQIRRFYLQLADQAEGLPVFIHDCPSLHGVELSTELLLRLARDAANLAYVVVESQPTGRRVSRLLKESAGTVRVFGGLAGQLFREEIARGASGSMPLAVFTDVLVATWNAIQAKDHKAALRIERATRSLLFFASQSLEWSVHSQKALFHRGGLIGSARVREPTLSFDSTALEELLTLASDADLAVLRA